ncbi:MAG: ParB/RepB/Spo0J family partition protein [Myxococcota bacterium]
MTNAQEKRRALGKGIDALFGGAKDPNKAGAHTTSTPAVVGDPKRNILNVAIEDVHPNKSQPRKDFDAAALEELAASIKEHGLMQPILVRKKAQGYEIIAGERRWRATQKAGLKTIDVIVKDYSDPDVFVLALIENIQREDLNPIELAKAYKQLMDDQNLTQDQVAERVGKDRSTVANSLRLMKLPAEVQRQVVAGALSMGHARALLALEDEEAISKMAKEIVKRGLSVREVEKLVREDREKAETPEGAPGAVDPYAAIPGGAAAVKRETEALIRRLSARVRIAVNGRRGKIEIDFGSPDELDRILSVLKGD